MSWIQPSEAEMKNSRYSLERATPSNPTFSFKSPQTVDPGSCLPISSSPSPAVATLAQACVSPLSAALASLPQPPPQTVLSLDSLLRTGKEREHTHRSSLYPGTPPISPALASFHSPPACSQLSKTGGEMDRAQPAAHPQLSLNPWDRTMWGRKGCS